MYSRQATAATATQAHANWRARSGLARNHDATSGSMTASATPGRKTKTISGGLVSSAKLLLAFWRSAIEKKNRPPMNDSAAIARARWVFSGAPSR